MEKTYTEIREELPFNWLNALKALIEKENNPDNIHDKEYLEKLDNLASDWVTCACGNQCSIIPRNAHGVPRDNTLKWLGCTFYAQISNWRFKDALETLLLIEERSAQIISEINPKPLQ